MIARLDSYGSLPGTVGYILDAAKAAALLLSPSIPTLDLADRIIRDSGSRARANAKPFVHGVLSFELREGKDVDLARAFRITEDVLRVLGLKDEHAWAASCHADATHRHVHFVASRSHLVTNELAPSVNKQSVFAAIAEVARDHGLTAPDSRRGIGRGARSAETWNGRESAVRKIGAAVDAADPRSWADFDRLIEQNDLDWMVGRRKTLVILDRGQTGTVAVNGNAVGLTRERLAAWGPMPTPPERSENARTGYRDRLEEQQLAPDLAAHPSFDPTDPRYNPRRLGEAMRRGPKSSTTNRTSQEEKTMPPTRIGPAPATRGNLGGDVEAAYARHLKNTIDLATLQAFLETQNNIAKSHGQDLPGAIELLAQDPLGDTGHTAFARALAGQGRANRTAHVSWAINAWHLRGNHYLTFDRFVERYADEHGLDQDERKALLESRTAQTAILAPEANDLRASYATLAGLRAEIDESNHRAIYSRTTVDGSGLAQQIFSVDREGWFEITPTAGNSSDAKRAMLLAAAARYDNRIVIVDGDRASRVELAALAGELGITVSGDELQQAWKEGVQRRATHEQKLTEKLRGAKTGNELTDKTVDGAIRKAFADEKTLLAGYGATRLQIVDNTNPIGGKPPGHNTSLRYADRLLVANEAVTLARGGNGTLYAVKVDLPGLDEVKVRDGEPLAFVMKGNAVAIERPTFEEARLRAELQREDTQRASVDVDRARNDRADDQTQQPHEQRDSGRTDVGDVGRDESWFADEVSRE